MSILATGFAGALDAERVGLARDVVEAAFEARHVLGARHGVVDEGAGEKLARIRIVFDVLDQGLAEALGQAADDLAFDDQRIDDHANIVDDGVAVDLDLAGVGIDLELANVTAIGEVRDAVRGAGRLQADAEIRR
jgi:hypothetical protein